MLKLDTDGINYWVVCDVTHVVLSPVCDNIIEASDALSNALSFCRSSGIKPSKAFEYARVIVEFVESIS